jgi:proline iminopeptidase
MNRPALNSFEDVIETPAGRTFVRTMGRGPSVFVIHGGPGFDHSYLLSALSSLADRRTLVFYDQPGCGRTPLPAEGLSVAGCAGQLRALFTHFSADAPIGVIAHSWGALVLAAALSRPEQHDRPLPEIAEGLLINPMPATSDKYDSARATLVGRIPLTARIRAPLTALLTGNGAAVMKLLLPYYVVDQDSIPADGLAVDLSTFKALDAQLKQFDFADNLAALRRVAIVRGSHEFASCEDIVVLTDQCAALHTMDQVGHFPFWESPKAFQAIIQRTFG